MNVLFCKRTPNNSVIFKFSESNCENMLEILTTAAENNELVVVVVSPFLNTNKNYLEKIFK